MSAWLLDPEHINVLIWEAIHRRATDTVLRTYTADQPTPFNGITPTGYSHLNKRELRAGTESLYGQFLVDANAASVNARYLEENSYVYDYRTPRHLSWSAVEILGALNCYGYQSCEVENWAASEAKAFCDQLRRRMEAELPGMAEAPWDITAESRPRRGY